MYAEYNNVIITISTHFFLFNFNHQYDFVNVTCICSQESNAESSQTQFTIEFGTAYIFTVLIKYIQFKASVSYESKNIRSSKRNF